MDSKGFRIRGEPDLVREPGWGIVSRETQREIDATKTTPAPDSRYSAYAAPMADGRLVTDYRPSCVTRAPPGTQFAVKQWTVHNTDDVIRISRQRQVENTGQALGTADTELPPAQYQDCSTDKCQIYSSGNDLGVGIERRDKCPELFGTFTFPADFETSRKNISHVSLNLNNEYGRNTSRRWANLYQE